MTGQHLPFDAGVYTRLYAEPIERIAARWHLDPVAAAILRAFPRRDDARSCINLPSNGTSVNVGFEEDINMDDLWGYV